MSKSIYAFTITFDVPNTNLRTTHTGAVEADSDFEAMCRIYCSYNGIAGLEPEDDPISSNDFADFVLRHSLIVRPLTFNNVGVTILAGNLKK